MADRPHLRLADHTDLANDDPFAELTKIMGFDPRQPVRPAQATQPPEFAPAAVDDGFDELDFSIDLEKELMGEFADEPEFAALPPVPEPKVEQPVQSVSYPDLDFADASPNREQPSEDEIAFDEDWFSEDQNTVSSGPQASPPAAPISFAPEEFDFADSEDLDFSVEDDLPVQDTLDDDLMPAMPAPANDIPDVMVAEPHFSADDLTDTAEPEEFALDPSEPRRPDSGIFGRLPGAANPSTTDDVEIDHIFEGALADVDMHFDSAPAVSAVHAPEPSLDSELDLGLETADETDTAGDHAYADHDVYDEDKGGQPEGHMSLEDELNALLGNARGAQRNAPVSVHALPEIPAFQSSALDIVDTDTADVPYESPLNYDVPVVTAHDAPVAGEDLEWEAEVPAEAHAAYPKSAYAPDSTDKAFDDIDLEFDEHSFDDAMAQSFSEPTVAVYREEPVFEPAATVQVDPEISKPASNPYAALSALSASLAPTRFAPQVPVYARREPEPVFDAGNQTSNVFEQNPALPEMAAEPTYVAAGYTASDESYIPDIDTLDVPEQAVALADDLDLPDFAYEDDPAPAPTYDDIDAEFTSLLNDMNASDTEVPEPVAGSAVALDFSDEFDRGLAPTAAPVSESSPHLAQYAAATVAAAAFHPVAAAASPASSNRVLPDPAKGHGQTVGDDDLADMEFAYDPDLDEEMALPAFAPAPQRPAPRRGMMIAAVVGGVALLGGVGAFALSFGGGTGSNEPVLVKADDTPVKVKPENPGGTTIPNQDNKVYDTVAGGSSAADPKQDTLVSTEEEPLEMPAPVDEAEDSFAADDAAAATETDAAAVPPSQKAEDRVEQVAEAPGVDNSVEVAAVAPRKVRTMVVKADGTLVAREEPSAAPSSASAGMSDPVATVGTQATGAVAGEAAPVDDADGEATLPIATAPAAEAAPVVATLEPAEPTPAPALAPVAKAQDQSSNTPASVPVAPGRPSDQPVDIVGEVKADKVAAVSSAAAASGAWAMQIASQPTEAAAKSSYQNLSRRYATVLDGRQASIVKADIAGKGTFWRVRVAASSRNEAVTLCESYKSAGGNCFVSK